MKGSAESVNPPGIAICRWTRETTWMKALMKRPAKLNSTSLLPLVGKREGERESLSARIPCAGGVG